MGNLTQKQTNFCYAYLKTGNASEAYRQAYNAKKMKTNVIANKASLLLTKGYIRVMIDSLRGKIEDEGILDFKQIQKMLSKKALEELNSDGLKSIDILNKMSGNYAKDNTIKMSVDFETSILKDIQEKVSGRK